MDDNDDCIVLANASRHSENTQQRRNIERKYLPCNRPRPVQWVRDWLRKQQRLYSADDTEFATRFYRVCV